MISGCYATAAERLVKAIGEPQIIDTSKDGRYSRIFQNRTIRVYPAFKDFYGMEDVIERLVGFLIHASQGLEEARQILYMVGPVGGGKSTLADRIKSLMEREPIYVLKAGNNLSPVFESPLGLFPVDKFGELLETKYNIPKRYLNGLLSPWAVKRLDEFGGDLTKFKVVKLYPSNLRQIGVARTEPGDENNQDISSLTGKVDLRQLDKFSQNDPDAYSYSGALCRSNQGVLEFVEMFKAPIKTLHPLLTATQEAKYIGTEEIGAIPFSGLIISHSNFSEWEVFKNNKNNEAFLDRIYTVKVPYCLRVDEEVKIYKKMIENSSLRTAPIAPHTLELLAQFAVLTRLEPHENSNSFAKMRVYNGEDLVDQEIQAKPIQEYKDAVVNKKEGEFGVSTRFAFKILSMVYNYDPVEVAADPVHLFHILREAIKREQFEEKVSNKYYEFLDEFIINKYGEKIGKEIQTCYLESYDDFGQNIQDRYFNYAAAWCEKLDWKDPDTGVLYNREALDEELQKLERPANIANAKDFRNEIVLWINKYRSKHGENAMPNWKSFQKLRDVIEKKMMVATEDLLPVISYNAKKSKEEDKKHAEFVQRMQAKRGTTENERYTERMCQRVVEWWMRFQKS